MGSVGGGGYPTDLLALARAKKKRKGTPGRGEDDAPAEGGKKGAKGGNRDKTDRRRPESRGAGGGSAAVSLEGGDASKAAAANLLPASPPPPRTDPGGADGGCGGKRRKKKSKADRLRAQQQGGGGGGGRGGGEKKRKAAGEKGGEGKTAARDVTGAKNRGGGGVNSEAIGEPPQKKKKEAAPAPRPRESAPPPGAAGPLRRGGCAGPPPGARTTHGGGGGGAGGHEKLGGGGRKGAHITTPAEASDHPFDVDPTDHCETPFEAYFARNPEAPQCARLFLPAAAAHVLCRYKDVEPLISQLAVAMGKTKDTVRIYDPYFCEGSVVRHLGKLGFKHVYNKNEDFYQVPEHDIVVTNPPYSLDHMERILKFVSQHNQGRPWLLCLPNFVYRKSYFPEATGQPKLPAPAYLVPQIRYDYYSPGRGKHELFGPKVTSPFDSFWYLQMGEHAGKIASWWRKKHGDVKSGPRLAASEEELPKIVRTEKRLNPKQRKKMKKKMLEGSWRRLHPEEDDEGLL